MFYQIHLQKIKNINFFLSLFISFSSLYGMDGKKPNNIIDLKQKELQAKKEFEDAHRNWKNTPKSWYEGEGTPAGHQASQKVVEAEKKYNQLKRMNQYQQQQANFVESPFKFGSPIISAVNLATATGFWRQKNKSHEAGPTVNNAHDEKEKGLFENSPFKSFKYRDKNLKKFSEAFIRFNDEAPEADTLNAHRDAFIRGALSFALHTGLNNALGIPGALAFETISHTGQNMHSLRNKIDNLQQHNVSNPVADAMYAMHVGCTYQESLKGMSAGLAGMEKLANLKGKIIDYISRGVIAGSDKIGLTEQNINTLAAFVHESIKNAPEYIKKSYKQLLAKNKDNAQAIVLPPHGFSQLSPAQVEKLKKQKKLLDADIALSPQETTELVAQMFEEQQQQLEELIVNYSEHIRQRSANAPEPSRNETKFKNGIATAQDAFAGAAAVASILGRKNDAYAITTFGFASVQAMNSFNTLMTAGPLAAGINPYVGILTSIASLCSLAEDEAQDNTQEIIDAITNGIIFLSQQMYRLQEAMHEEFGQVKQMLTQGHLKALEEFLIVHQDSAMALDKIKNLNNYIKDNALVTQSGLGSLHTKMNNNFNMTIDNLRGLRIEKIDELTQRLLLMLQRGDVSYQEFNDCIQALYIKATSRASADALTGGAIDIQNISAVATALEPVAGTNVFSHPAFSNINLLSKLMASEDNGFNHTKLVNPLILTKCADTIVHSMQHKLFNDAQYPETAQQKNLDIEKLMLLKNEGEKIMTFIKTIGQNRYAVQIANKYEQALQELSRAIKDEQKIFEEQETKSLVREQANSIEREKSQAKRIFDSHSGECKECVKHVADAITKSDKIGAFDRFVAVPPYWYRKPAYFRKEVVSIESKPNYRINYENSKYVTQEEVRNPIEQFKKLQQDYVQAIAQQEQELRQNTKVDLTKQEFNPIGEAKSQWVLPASQHEKLPTLMLPREKLLINPFYLAAENNCLGALSHEYAIDGKKLHLRSFFTIKDTQQKIEVLHISKECPFDNLYGAHENILHFWYGGRYPQSTDTYTYKANDAYSYGGYNTYSAYYPPETVYPAERDMFVSTSQREPDQADQYLAVVQQLIVNDKEKKRLEFNKQITGAASSNAAVSPVYNEVQKVDIYFKILDSLLTLMHSDLMHDDTGPLQQHFKAIKNDDDIHYVKNSAALTRYLTSYAAKKEQRQGHYLPFYLEYTTRKLSQKLNTIFHAQLPAQLNPVTRVIDSINVLVRQYQARVIQPRIAALQPALPLVPVLEQMRQEMADKDKKIGALITTNQQLAKDNKLLAAETRVVKQELAEVKQQLQAIMALLAQMNNNRPQ